MTEAKKERQRVKTKALRDYDKGDPLRDIAVRYGVSPGTVSLWAKAGGRVRRPQGCRKKDWPDERDIQIVEAVRAVVDGKPTLDAIGAQVGMTRAGVHRIFQKWKNWRPRVPFKPGETIRFMRRDYEVVKPDVFDGLVRDLKTKAERRLRWKPDGKHSAVRLYESTKCA